MEATELEARAELGPAGAAIVAASGRAECLFAFVSDCACGGLKLICALLEEWARLPRRARPARWVAEQKVPLCWPAPCQVGRAAIVSAAIVCAATKRARSI